MSERILFKIKTNKSNEIIIEETCKWKNYDSLDRLDFLQDCILKLNQIYNSELNIFRIEHEIEREMRHIKQEEWFSANTLLSIFGHGYAKITNALGSIDLDLNQNNELNI